MKQIKMAIIGQGRSGHNIHGRALKMKKDKFNIAFVVDLLEDRRKRAESEYGCETYSDYRELFGMKDIDLVLNATPSHLHVPISIDLLNHGFNVLCEKPLARKVSDVDLLIDTAKKNNKVFAIFQQSRYAPYFKQVRSVINSGVLGRIIQVSIYFNGFARRWDWQTVKKYNGGNLMNNGPHPLDQALQLFGTDIMPDVTCSMDRVNSYGDGEDYVKILLRGKNRPVIDLEISSCCAYPVFTYLVQGSKGGLKGSMEHIDWKYFKPEEAPEQHLIETPLSDENGLPCFGTEKLKWYEESWDIPKENIDFFPVMTGEFYDMLYRTLTEGKDLEVSPYEVRRQIQVIEECYRQAGM